MKVWVISDTHTQHWSLIPPEVDMVIHAGDMTNHKNPDINFNELMDFLDWYEKLPIKYKIFIAGNHDTSIQNNRIKRSDFIARGLIYLEHESVEIEGIKIFGSPYTPTFGVGWAFNKDRSKLDAYWREIPEDTDIIVTHGPPIGIMDHTYSNGRGTDGERIKGSITSTGCRALLRHVERVEPKVHIFGHLHDEDDVSNAGTFKKSGEKTLFINASVVTLRHEFKNTGEIINV